MAFNYNRALQVWAIPLLLVAFFAYFVAQSFLSVFETVLDALFLCFAVDRVWRAGPFHLLSLGLRHRVRRRVDSVEQ